ncbi:variable surface protein [Plasmodium gonderi]|uniref:Variable surface protein n=1 Tax=Plasmodium gonderi TaxID=77519 RepID=A0A1Y1JNT0_PLAGO|nr:variable surface protein [Plasmodium gonderi]GAW84131.1 variable surface protein [Plasmodium gonderi]
MKETKNMRTFVKIRAFLMLTWIYSIIELSSIGKILSKSYYLNGKFGIKNQRILAKNGMEKELKNPQMDEHNCYQSGNTNLRIENNHNSSFNQLEKTTNKSNSVNKSSKKNKLVMKSLLKNSNLRSKERIIAEYKNIKNIKQRIELYKARRRRNRFIHNFEFFFSFFSFGIFLSIFPTLLITDYFSKTHYNFLVFLYYGACVAFIAILALAIIYLMD